MNNLTPDILCLWPIWIYLDSLVPESACSAIGAFIDVDDDVCALTIKLVAMDAERGLTKN